MNFVYFCITHRNLLGYIFLILQHFATKLCNFTNFKLLFLAIMHDGFRSSCLDQNLVYIAGIVHLKYLILYGVNIYEILFAVSYCISKYLPNS